MRASAIVSGLLACACGPIESDLHYQPAYLVPDVDGDGLAEAIYVDGWSERLVLESSATKLAAWRRQATSPYAFFFQDAADWNGDGVGDLVFHGVDALRVADGGSGDLLWVLQGRRRNVRVLGDLDGDGTSEVVCVDQLESEMRGAVSVRKGGTYETLWRVRGASWTCLGSCLAVADVEGAGELDVVCTDAQARLRAYEGRTGELLFETCWSKGRARAWDVDLLVLERGAMHGGNSLVLVDLIGTRGQLHGFSPSTGALEWSAGLPHFAAYRDNQRWQLVAVADQSGDGVPDVLAGAVFELGGVVCSGADGTVLRTIAREHLVPQPELGARYDPGADLDGDGVADFVVNLGSYKGLPAQDCAFAFSGRDLTMLRKLR